MRTCGYNAKPFFHADGTGTAAQGAPSLQQSRMQVHVVGATLGEAPAVVEGHLTRHAQRCKDLSQEFRSSL